MLVGSVNRAVEAMPLVIAIRLKRQKQALPLTSLRPSVETIENGLPRSEVRWEISPWDACAAPPQHRFDESPIIIGWSAGSAF
jgi:hypothetical protein